MDPKDIDLDAAHAERIGFASSAGEGKPRWTELAVYYLHQPPSRGRSWLSQSIGRSSVPGETDRVQRLYVGSLDRALKLFEDTDMGVVVSEEARDWKERNITRIVADALTPATILKAAREDAMLEHQHVSIGTSRVGKTAFSMMPHSVPSTDADAIAWLYDGKLDDTPRATFAAMLARDFDLAPRTVTTALKENTPIRVPLRMILPFVDRAAFRAWRNGEKSDD